MAYTQADLDRVDAAIAKGASSVTLSSGERIEYRSVRALKAARDHIARQLHKAARRPRAFRVYTSKGL
ncbi:phage head-tail joining protein [Arhodomonas sp. AD133]|uniref:phage head-tail joining protein n=1 Tax=Arhodomonas sp. AD133 TaxID=3415009 RepID=UPI003EB6D4F0